MKSERVKVKRGVIIGPAPSNDVLKRRFYGTVGDRGEAVGGNRSMGYWAIDVWSYPEYSCAIVKVSCLAFFLLEILFIS
jgi:hypothetical protein